MKEIWLGDHSVSRGSLNKHCFSQSCSNSPIQKCGAHLNTTIIFSRVRKLRIAKRTDLSQLLLQKRLIIQGTVICFWQLSVASGLSVTSFAGNYFHWKPHMCSAPHMMASCKGKEWRPRVYPMSWVHDWESSRWKITNWKHSVYS